MRSTTSLPSNQPRTMPSALARSRVGVQAVQLEHGLDAVPRVVGEQHVLAVVERAVVAAAEGALGQPVRLVLILDVLGRQAQLALLRLDVDGQVAGGRAVVLVVLGGQEVHQVGMIRAAGPAPPRRELDVKPHVDGVRRLEQPAQARRAFRRRRARLPVVLDAAAARVGPLAGDRERPAVVPAAFSQPGVIEGFAEEHARRPCPSTPRRPD